MKCPKCDEVLVIPAGRSKPVHACAEKPKRKTKKKEAPEE